MFVICIVAYGRLSNWFDPRPPKWTTQLTNHLIYSICPGEPSHFAKMLGHFFKIFKLPLAYSIIKNKWITVVLVHCFLKAWPANHYSALNHNHKHFHIQSHIEAMYSNFNLDMECPDLITSKVLSSDNGIHTSFNINGLLLQVRSWSLWISYAQYSHTYSPFISK